MLRSVQVEYEGAMAKARSLPVATFALPESDEVSSQPSSCAVRDSRYGAGMFGLTRNEQALVVGFLFIFLLGFGVRQWRESAAFRAVPTVAP